MNCPICNTSVVRHLLTLNCGNIDDSFLYDPAIIMCCSLCGHVFNCVGPEDRHNIYNYYNHEYSNSNLDSRSVTSDVPGSSEKNPLLQHTMLYDIIRPHTLKDCKILDIGCATGRLLQFLSSRGYCNLFGIDPSRPYINFAKQDRNYIVDVAFAEDIPYNTEFFDLLIADQVVEHLFFPGLFFDEARRVLKPDGLLYIGVPDSIRYHENDFFSFYWFIMREHVQHFDLSHLVSIASKYGFSLVRSVASTYPMLNDACRLPSLAALFRLDGKLCDNGNSDKVYLENAIRGYMQQSRVQAVELFRLVDQLPKNEPMYVYGVSREFLYLYRNTELSKCNIVGIVDDTVFKQKNHTIDGKKIVGSNVLRDSNDSVLITATAHTDIIKRKLADILNFRGRVIGL